VDSLDHLFEKMMSLSAQDPREMTRILIGETSIAVDVMIYHGTLTDRQPLVIVNSLELPVPPSETFCEQMWRAGYQVVFFRRIGFGGAPGLPTALLTEREVKNGAAVTAEAALLKLLIETLDLKRAVLLGMGTSNPVCFRLSKLSPDVQFSIFANPLFNQAVWDIIRPPWLQSMMRQTVGSRSGLKIAVMGLKATLKRSPMMFYRQFAQKSPGDGDYIAANADDFHLASKLLQNISPDTVFYDLRMSLVEDTLLETDYFDEIDAVILAGEETTEDWRRHIRTEADRLSLPVTFAPSGDLFVPYASPESLLAILETNRAGAQPAIV